jgi:hypothetical protein
MKKQMVFSPRDMTRAALERAVIELMSADDANEKDVIKKLMGNSKNDLADLDEEMHGKPNVPQVTEDDLPSDGELADLPKKKGKKV